MVRWFYISRDSVPLQYYVVCMKVNGVKRYFYVGIEIVGCSFKHYFILVKQYFTNVHVHVHLNGLIY